jgi:hypothetical protein
MWCDHPWSKSNVATYEHHIRGGPPLLWVADHPFIFYVPLLNVLSFTLDKLIQYCRCVVELNSKSAGAGNEEDDKKKVMESSEE